MKPNPQGRRKHPDAGTFDKGTSGANCPGLMNSHTPLGGNQLDCKRDEINPKSL